MTRAVSPGQLALFPDRWNPPAIVKAVHDAASFIGYSRVRIDRGVWLGDLSDPHATEPPAAPYYEAGYGVGTVRIRTSDPKLFWEVTKETYSQNHEMHALRAVQLLADLIGGAQ